MNRLLISQWMTDQCMMQFAPNAVNNAKCHSSQQKAGQYFAEIVTNQNQRDSVAAEAASVVEEAADAADLAAEEIKVRNTTNS